MKWMKSKWLSQILKPTPSKFTRLNQRIRYRLCAAGQGSQEYLLAKMRARTCLSCKRSALKLQANGLPPTHSLINLSWTLRLTYPIQVWHFDLRGDFGFS